ncbi:MAG TPA: DUF305 domain-containing protein [Gemmatimonadales bacterium]|nr:DUF305 domain-containing protein [Gemmatimonadales bacterium]
MCPCVLRPERNLTRRRILNLRAALASAAFVATPAARIAAQMASESPAPRPVDTFTAADVHFMSGMIQHHAQAVLMAGWASTHGASPAMRALCERIVVGQRDEIVLMRRWLTDRHQAVPESDASHMMMAGMEHAALMPGMLTADELTRVDRARGREFDALFLQYMIRHHQGAITMVNELFASRGAGEEEPVYRFAANVFADQTTEIERMQRMLADLLSAGP